MDCVMGTKFEEVRRNPEVYHFYRVPLPCSDCATWPSGAEKEAETMANDPEQSRNERDFIAGYILYF